MAEKPRLVVFEDNQDNFVELRKALLVGLGDGFAVEPYDGARELKDGDWSRAENWVREFLLKPSPAELAVLDWDLSGFRHPAPQQLIRGIAEDNAIPIVLYQSHAEQASMDRLRHWQERRIAIPSNVDRARLAKLSADAVLGFHQIRSRVASLGDKPRLLETLRELLNPPSDVVLHLEQFAVGNQEVLAIAESARNGENYSRLVATWIGYLIYNRILQFPGPILTAAAAAAYLAISKEEIAQPDVLGLLDHARYTGPFAATFPAWWRSGLDALIVGAMEKTDTAIPTGRISLERHLKRELKRSQCREGEQLDESGFLCVLTGECVCSRHSDAPDAWIPQGADLCRIHREEFETLRAWLGDV